MVRALLAGLSLSASGAVTVTAQKAQPRASFSLVLESTRTGWAAQCDSGCRWRQLSFDCRQACGAVIDADGVVTLAAARRDSTAFRFVVEHTPTGVRAIARSGTAWQALSWDCGAESCRARVDQRGVYSIDRRR
jgi:hypothetical protein